MKINEIEQQHVETTDKDTWFKILNSVSSQLGIKVSIDRRDDIIIAVATNDGSRRGEGMIIGTWDNSEKSGIINTAKYINKQLMKMNREYGHKTIQDLIKMLGEK